MYIQANASNKEYRLIRYVRLVKLDESRKHKDIVKYLYLCVHEAVS